MNSNNHEYYENNYHEKFNRKYETENKPLKNIKNYNTQSVKRGTYDGSQYSEEYFPEHSYDTAKPTSLNSYYTNNKKMTQNESLSDKQNYKIRSNNIHPDYNININNNDIMRINTITYCTERDDKNKGRSVSITKKNQFLENNLSINNKNSKIDENNLRNMNKVELENNAKNNGNLIFINSNKNTSIKIINKTKNNNYMNSNSINENRDIINNNRRKNKNEVYISNKTINNNFDNKSNEKENKYNKYTYKNNNDKEIKVSGFEISYESDKGEKNSNNSYKKHRNNIINYYNNNNNNNNYNFKYNNIYYSNINLEERNRNSNNNDFETNNKNTSYNNISNLSNQKDYQNKYQIVHNNSSINNNVKNASKKRININDSVEINDLNNNKSISIVNGNRRKNIKANTSIINSNQIKENKIYISKKNENKIFNSNLNSNRNNKNIDIINLNNNNSNSVLKSDILTNMSIDNSMKNNPKIINKRNSASSHKSNNSHNLSKSKNPGNIRKKIRYINYYRKSDIKKLILIQSIYRAHLLNLKLSKDFQLFTYTKELFFLLYNIILLRKNNYWKIFLNKLSKIYACKSVNRRKNKKNTKNNKNEDSLKNKVILKTKEVNNMLNKETGDLFNIINDNNILKLKLDNIIKENNELKNQIFDNKNIEEKLKQLLEENKKNQNINAIIMKDNQQLAKRLKNIQDNRNNQLVIQNQKSIDLAMEDNLQFQSLNKLKDLYLKYLVFKKILKNRNVVKSYFNRYKNNVKKLKTYAIENNNIFINNKKKINIQMAKNFNINFISQNDNYKNFHLYKIFLKKEKEKLKYISKYFYKFIYLSNYKKFLEEEEKIKIEKEKEIIENKNEQKRNIMQSIIDKYERNCNFLCKKTLKEWKLRGVIFKMKGIAKEIKKKKKLKKKIRDKIAKETLNNLKNRTATFQSAHEFIYKNDKIEKNDNSLNIENKEIIKSEEKKNKQGKIKIKEEEAKNENNIDDREDSEESFGIDD